MTTSSSGEVRGSNIRKSVRACLRHPYMTAFVGLSFPCVLLCALVHWMIWGYAFSPPYAPADSLVKVDVLCGYSIDPYASPKTLVLGTPPKLPIDEVRASSEPGDPNWRILESLDRRGLLPSKWITPSLTSVDELVDPIVLGEGSYGRPPSEVRYVNGFVVQGRDRSGREIMVISALDRTTFPIFVPYFEFTFVRPDRSAKWVMVSRQRYYKDESHLAPWTTSVWTFIAAFEAMILLLLLVIRAFIWSIKKLMGRKQHSAGFEVTL